MSPLVPGAYQPTHDHDIEEPQVHVPALPVQEPYPGTEVGGPALTDLVRMLDQVARGQEALYRQAQLEARERYYTFEQSAPVDSGADVAVELFSVPQGATGHLCWAFFTTDGVNGVSTNVTVNSLGIFAAQPGLTTRAQVYATMGQLDWLIGIGSTATQRLPSRAYYSHPFNSPTIVGPLSFYAIAENVQVTALRMVVKGGVLVRQPEP